MVSPHTRGWTRRRSGPKSSCCGFPRTRGDGYEESSPPTPVDTRGWTQVRPICRSDQDGFPAHAGMDPCGPKRHRTERRGFPAHAGMDPRPALTGRPCSWFPRTRGDGPGTIIVLDIAGEVSPHTRGWTPRRPLGRGLGWVSPHTRGWTRRGLSPRWTTTRFPRTRGDGPRPDGDRGGAPRVSPHTRGWTLGYGRGSHPALMVSPHTRGWTRSGRCGGGRGSPVSPHTRGWTRRQRGRGRRAGGFPAHAGMDPCTSETT